MLLRVNGICRGRLDECAHRRCTARFCHAILYRPRIESTRLVGHDVTHLDMLTFWSNVRKKSPVYPIVGRSFLHWPCVQSARRNRLPALHRKPKVSQSALPRYSARHSPVDELRFLREIMKERTRMTPFVGRNLLRDTWRMFSSLAVH